MKIRKRLIFALVAGTVILSTFSLYVYQMLYTPNVLVERDAKVVYVSDSTDFTNFLKQLFNDKVIEDPASFGFVAKAILDYDENMKPGRYLLTPNMTNLEAIRLLRSGAQTPIRITFNNVRFKEDLAGKITDNLEIDSVTFLKALNNPELLQKVGFTESTILAMFIPNTYEVYWTATPEELFDRMKSEYDRFWNEERLAKASKAGLTPLEVATLAGIIQEESNKPDEYPKIAGVYINRLKKGMLLQADPTLKFALGDFTIKRVLNKHKEIDSPYNTYMYAGLPPGPINCPEIKSLEGVLNYEDHGYYYFCARPDFSGYHDFASSLSEHLRNANKYQRALDRAKIYR
ncbi:endolytic transglycosylase MltG [Marinigracilibium pacificum]|uniref:Endolytic murein transglycosylase n=1 Tax=Marinigracilibium pacificum TaxID=2729599 RepID=A0A848J2N0_9BACT|nr:endolytic transglycosylase MltG [Marinigracilibium pacificum]NMM48744.1 endolytic transglycosylase MltG [Marinigracilibium pacificum]